MTITMQSFDSSPLGAFVKSNLNVRGGGVGGVWHASRGDGADVDSIVYDLDPADFSIFRLAHLSPGVQVEGCGGKEDILFMNTWDGISGGGHIGEYPVDAESWAEENWPLTPDRGTSDWINPDGIGGDTETLWVSFINSTGSGGDIWEMDQTDWSYIRHTPAVYTRCDAVGGSSTACWCSQLETSGFAITGDHWMQLDVNDLTNELQDRYIYQPLEPDLVTEGIGGSDVRVWINRTYWDDNEATGQMFGVDAFDLLSDGIVAASPAANPRGTGGS